MFNQQQVRLYIMSKTFHQYVLWQYTTHIILNEPVSTSLTRLNFVVVKNKYDAGHVYVPQVIIYYRHVKKRISRLTHDSTMLQSNIALEERIISSSKKL